MDDGDRNERVTANEPQAGAGGESAGTGQPHGTVAPSPAEAAERENEVGDDTAGDGVAFFEGGDGREEARGDMERGG